MAPVEESESPTLGSEIHSAPQPQTIANGKRFFWASPLFSSGSIFPVSYQCGKKNGNKDKNTPSYRINLQNRHPHSKQRNRPMETNLSSFTIKLRRRDGLTSGLSQRGHVNMRKFSHALSCGSTIERDLAIYSSFDLIDSPIHDSGVHLNSNRAHLFEADRGCDISIEKSLCRQICYLRCGYRSGYTGKSKFET